ncbi:FAD-binding domain-containing protein [Marasmius fiardii PR-910]|nr:FAD-binding domain-containing protein [Marasmius fiardii PR-910]
MFKSLRLLLLLVSSVHLGVSAQDQAQSVFVDPSVGSKCCDTLHDKLPSLVFAHGTPEYQVRQTTYYSLQQQELSPTCIVRPSSASDVSRIVKIAKDSECPFAVASGGHMSWKGSSNVDGGFVIDLRGMNQIDVSLKDQSVKLGPGSLWQEVYRVMAPYNVSAAGGRLNAVGVGGFLLGGGIAFASVDKGFGADNVFNYEVVLSDGRIVDANKDTNPDLFWALKLAGTNYGIVTRFDMHTYPSPSIWGALSVYPFTISTTSELLEDFERYIHDEKNRKDFKAVVLNYGNGMDLVMSCQTNLDSVPLAHMSSATPIMHLEKVGSTHDVVDEVIAHALESTARTAWFTLTTKHDTEFFVDLHQMGKTIFEPLKDRKGLTTTLGFQSFQKSYIEGAAHSPVYNALKRSNDDLVCVQWIITWTDPSDDLAMKEATNTVGAWGEAEARKRGILDDFLYLNYAGEGQRVYERAVTPEDLNKMQEIQKKYDSSGTFEKLWRGGFKLPKKGEAGATTAHDEL